MDWAMRDEQFKTQLFRFVDVLPALTSSSEISRHLKEYLGHEQIHLSAPLRAALKAASSTSWLFGPGVKAQVTALARQFMLGDEDEKIVATLRRLHDQDIAFTVDVLGETVVSEKKRTSTRHVTSTCFRCLLAKLPSGRSHAGAICLRADRFLT
jgi:RHH-type proline utilization regulon transcriptional repressor/proline dehydrogenase/delta 1-pyrroline-5-carboxylate dehydrogenase